MKLPEKFRLTLIGTTIDVIRRENVSAGIGHPLAQMLTGREMPDNILNPWYIDVVIAEADILGPISIHTLAANNNHVEIVCTHCGRSTIYEAKPLSELCQQRYYGGDLRDFGRQMLCDSRRGGCGKRGARITPASHAKRAP